MKHVVKKLTGKHVAKSRKSNASHLAAFKNTPSKVNLKKTARKRG